ncbi:MAG: DNA topoisomerase III [Defluviitaleaceae bacterium]|nr:DNA topoisomerase III [Defluviitaleaceae bacterium]
MATKELILAEKPSVARDIARVLGVRGKGDGFLFGDQYIVTWAVGHLVTLAEPEDYNPAYKKWHPDTLPIIPDQIKLKPISKTKDQLGVIKKLFSQSDVGTIICATDSGREGELIFRYIYDIIGSRKPVKRLWISSMTDEAIREGFSNLKDGAAYDNLAASAKCRSHADWLVGINASRAFTLKYDVLLSVGRVQTPTLALLVARAQEIDDFVPKEYYEVAADFTTEIGAGYYGTYFELEAAESGSGQTRQTRIDSGQRAKEIAAAASGKPATISELTTEEKRQPPPLLYDLTELQREANRRFGYSAQKTLDIAQSLYEKRKLITYPRTDSRYLSTDMKPKLPGILQKLAKADAYTEFVAMAQQSGSSAGKRVVDDSKISDHHAIIPTATTPNLQALSSDERDIYDLVARRFIQVFCPNYVYRVTTVVTSVHKDGSVYNFVSKGKIVAQEGWMALNPPQATAKAGKTPKAKAKSEEIEDDQALPQLSQSESVHCTAAKAVQKRTQPPKPYNEATLLSAMEHAGRFVEDEDLRERLKESGLGTPATRAATIERLIEVGYVTRAGKTLVPTEKGRKLVAAVPPELKTPETTGKWEKGLGSIAKGTLGSERFMQSIGRYVHYIVEFTRNTGSNISFPEDVARKAARGRKSAAPRPLGACPKCNDGSILENSKAFGCSKWKTGCKFTIWKNALAKDGVDINAESMAKLLATGSFEASPPSKGVPAIVKLRNDLGALVIVYN